MASLKSIPPLIPLPSGAPPPTLDKNDAYASLFSPDTPPATSTFASSTSREPRPPISHNHRRNTSSGSDFGAFVSVPASDHPLHDDGVGGATDAFDRATGEKDQKRYLAEILAHEDDPLYWVHASTSGGTTTPTRPATPQPSPAPAPAPTPPQSSSTSTLTAAEPGKTLIEDLNDSLLSDIDLLPTTFGHPKPTSSASHSHPQSKSEPHTRHPTRFSNFSLPYPVPHAGSEKAGEAGGERAGGDSDAPPTKAPIPRSPSLPPSPSRTTAPVLTRTLSSSTFASSSLPALPTRWMSSLLSSTRSSAPARASSPSSATTSPTPSHLPPPHQTAPAPPHHSSTVPLPLPLPRTDEITHGSPFASHTLPPPSGAPGFAGDRNWNRGGFEFEGGAVERRNVRLVGRREGTNGVLDVRLADLIRPHLPALARLPKIWTLLYSLDQHGISLHTLYQRCEAQAAGGGGALVVVRDAGEGVFGAWMGEGVRRGRGAYYGSGESFLWKMKEDGEGLKVYKWTGKNEYVALCEPDYISFGGGDGTYGLYLDDTLFDGSSARCPTFDNEPLCSPGPRKATGTVAFECVGLEVWGVGGV